VALSDAIEELERKRAESNAKADESRAKRDRLNAEARTTAETRSRILDELHDKSAEAQDHRRLRDTFNTQVREESGCAKSGTTSSRSWGTRSRS